jgi:murein DD-endopeptidase MepM/ murein hydrolase activator NlpD
MNGIVMSTVWVVATAGHAAVPGWPPEPLIEMRVPVAPTAFPSTGRTHLVYEVRLTNLGKAALSLRRIEVRNADDRSAEPIAAFEAEQLDKVLQHFANPAIGDRMPDAVDGHRSLVAGESAILFLTLVLEPGVRVPERLTHRLFTGHSSIEGATVTAHTARLRVLAPPLEGTWRAFSGAGDNNSHHRRQFMVLGGRAAQPGRHAIDWKRIVDGQHISGPGDANRSYYSYGAPVLAVANGTVVAVKDGIPDNTPGHVGAEALKLTLDTVGGNFVVLDVGQGQFAHYMHLQPGSLRIKVGQRIRRGDVIARVGNSGSSFEPHLHFEVTTSPTLIVGEGLPYLLDEYEAVTEGSPQRRRRELPTKGTTVRFPGAN